MTQEDKELLLKDLCTRLPHGVKALNKEETITIRAYIPDLVIDEVGISHAVEDVKPYLFPLSSMTEEQESELVRITYSNNNDTTISYLTVDYLIQNHFDYRGLIEKGLAIDATGLNIY